MTLNDGPSPMTPVTDDALHARWRGDRADEAEAIETFLLDSLGSHSLESLEPFHLVIDDTSKKFLSGWRSRKRPRWRSRRRLMAKSV
jgi:hypothetical protein